MTDLRGKGVVIAINQPLMVRIGRARRSRCCVECGHPVPAQRVGVTCGSKRCMAKWLPGAKAVASETETEMGG